MAFSVTAGVFAVQHICIIFKTVFPLSPPFILSISIFSSILSLILCLPPALLSTRLLFSISFKSATISASGKARFQMFANAGICNLSCLHLLAPIMQCDIARFPYWSQYSSEELDWSVWRKDSMILISNCPKGFPHKHEHNLIADFFCNLDKSVAELLRAVGTVTVMNGVCERECHRLELTLLNMPGPIAHHVSAHTHTHTHVTKDCMQPILWSLSHFCSFPWRSHEHVWRQEQMKPFVFTRRLETGSCVHSHGPHPV